MKRCKTCSHYAVCDKAKHIENYRIGDCEHYADKSRFIELPCAVGDTVYFAANYEGDKFIDKGRVFAVSQENNGIWFSVIYESGLRYYHKSNDYGVRVFPTKSQTEKALERSEGK